MSGKRKYIDLAPEGASPELHFDLPELVYPERLNAVKTVFEHARENGWMDRVVYYCNGFEYTFEQLETSVGKTMVALVSAGVGRGDVVILRIPDTIDLVITLLAVQAIGAVAMPTYVQLRADDLVYRANDADARLLISTPNLLQEALPVADSRDGATKVMALNVDPEGRCRGLQEFMPEERVLPEFADMDAEELCLFLYTSGSTGAPKGAIHCHRDMLAICDTYWRHCIAPEPNDVLSGPPSIAFALGFGMFVYFPLRLGHAAVLEPDKSPEIALEQIQQYNVTIFAGVVSYYNRLAHLIRETGADISSIVHPMTGGEPLTEEVERLWDEVTGVPLEQFLGTTESLHCFVTSTSPNELPNKATIGHAVPGYEVAVLDPDTFEVMPDGEHGLFAMKGPTGSVYWNKPEHQEKIIRNGWNVYQDIVWRDEGGDFHYVARADEMIISAGYNISPVQVESVLLQHDAVVECACVPAPDPTGKRGMVVKAHIVTHPDYNPGGDLIVELQNFVKLNAAPYMYPRVVSFDAGLPKTVNGKILRSELRDLALRGTD
ncbi:MAG: Benzoate--CoA ligase [Alphaproteobacteria bacterium MarineAlpha11_Bin1]|nr:MAG: Benzoate--CoA ligase [Alphaproteobacteria bacterium MarineAlpha11_Bin1]|tara:strand:- start:3615 stop:5258 length:1644 start_codon:yes stop_codon:yes gene_type:complete